MIEKMPDTPEVLTEAGQKTTASVGARKPQNRKPSRLWVWLGSILIIGLLVVSVITYAVWSWLNGLQINVNSTAPKPAITTFNVQRTAPYANLSFTVLNAEYATSFDNDLILAGPATVRLNMHVVNKTNYAVTVAYYDVARLLVPGQQPIRPTNVHLSTGPKPGGSETGWIDFPVPKNTPLNTLQLRLGDSTTNETLVTIPFSGAFNPAHYNDFVSQQSLVIYYSHLGHSLVYHLNSIDVGYSYNGSQCKAGDQYYVLNFTVDNQSGSTASPGFGFDYIRLVYNGDNRPPFDNSLPHDFAANAHGVGGHVTFVLPAGIRNLTIGFLYQLYPGQSNYDVSM